MKKLLRKLHVWFERLTGHRVVPVAWIQRQEARIKTLEQRNNKLLSEVQDLKLMKQDVTQQRPRPNRKQRRARQART